MDDIFTDAESKMQQAIEALRKQLATIRTGKANPGLVENVMVEYYGNPTPLNQVGNISCPEPRLIVISPWEKPLLGEIERAILQANLGLTPQNDGDFIRISLPELSGDRRKELAKLAKSKAEDIKVSIRNIRRDANDQIKKKKDEGTSEDEVKARLDEMQELTDKYTGQADSISGEKEKEILTV